jgi:hypothetical protein
MELALSVLSDDDPKK